MSEVRSADGSTIGWTTIGSGPPILLVHGTALDRRAWNGVRRRLADRFTVHTMDRRGRGLSLAEHLPYDIVREAEDVAAVVEAVGRDVYVVGHSYGARCALEAALISDAVGRMFLYEPPMPTPAHRVARAGLLDRLRKLAATGDDDGVLSTFLLDALRLAPDTVPAMRKTKAWSALLANAPLISRELECVQRTDVLDRLGKVTVPVRLLVGTTSAEYMRPAAESIVAALPDADLVELPGQGHTANETAPDQLAGAIRDFAS
ncbi:MAG TPA: alpha/beta hydrolase [Jatrophihabitantaceae bacterium]